MTSNNLPDFYKEFNISRNTPINEIQDILYDMWMKAKPEERYKIEHKDSDIYNILVLGINGKPEPTIDNYYNVMTTDDFIKQHIKFNLLSITGKQY